MLKFDLRIEFFMLIDCGRHDLSISNDIANKDSLSDIGSMRPRLKSLKRGQQPPNNIMLCGW
jgi:hypothetical protein